MALGDLLGPVRPRRMGALLEDRRIGPEAHRASHGLDTQEVAQLVDDTVGGVLAELGRVRLLEAAQVARALDDRALEPQADAEEGDLPLAGVADRLDHPRHP